MKREYLVCEIMNDFVTSVKHHGPVTRIEYYSSIKTEQGKKFIFCKETLPFGSCLQHIMALRDSSSLPCDSRLNQAL